MHWLGKFTSAIDKQPLYVDLDLLATWKWSDGSMSTHVMLSGGGMAPVLEKPEEITKQKEAYMQFKEENKRGI